MKTAMQQLIEWIDTPNLYPDRISIKEKATELLEEEKRQKMDDWNAGLDEGGARVGNFEWGIKRKNVEFEQYYNQTYNNENKQDTVQ